ncbi:PDZ domain-containing protein [Trichonephila clavata]|nr:PDZ domain-containing protein [Trichonephila clavata]
MQALSRTARSALQKAFSTERIYRPEREERLEAAGQKGLQRSRSFIKGLTGSFRKKKRKSRPPMAEVVAQASSNPEWDEQPSGPNSPIHVRGQLLQLNLDGSQVVELTKPPSKPYGFFVARGRVRNSKGVFVSRMRDQETQKQLAGLLDIGDEILEIDGLNVKEADIMEVNSLMANKNTLLLTVLPYICRKDI